MIWRILYSQIVTVTQSTNSRPLNDQITQVMGLFLGGKGKNHQNKKRKQTTPIDSIDPQLPSTSAQTPYLPPL